MGKRVAFVLSGCGVKDGTEIHEAVSALIALDRAGFEVVFTAPDVQQTATVDHTTEKPEKEARNVLREGARIARGEIVPLSGLKEEDFDAVLFPGGFGAALTLCSFASDGPDCSVNPEVRALIETASNSGKPIAAMCIAPVILARTVPGAKLTVGNDPDTAGAIEKMGAVHVECPVDDAVVDIEKKIVTTPAYMLAGGPAEVYSGAERMVEELKKLF
ncbi:MAG: isoprenoid biosynthesis glyoxalase ElbB [Candidatus Aegiribacteria sp.]|nr:isoprenoid biosynthesis glyoxalase ElbB [Candidatus Aegiribacteria sp.]MBD3295399.1 isoprenoid biosynthesis glyoxalase ElbB [Candidatus Fermentibacteria bacterium]